MTYLTTLNTNRLINEFFNDPFFSPMLTHKKQTMDTAILADKENYSIWELTNGLFEVRVEFSEENSYYHKATTRQTLEEAEGYVEEQVAYHSRKLEGPKLVKSYRNEKDIETGSSAEFPEDNSDSQE